MAGMMPASLIARSAGKEGHPNNETEDAMEVHRSMISTADEATARICSDLEATAPTATLCSWCPRE